MRKKQLNFFSILILVLLSLFFFVWEHFFLAEPKSEAISEPTSQSIPQSKPKLKSIPANYDYVMANDSIGQNKQAKTDYYTLVLSWSPAFCDSQRERYGKNLPTSMQLQCDTTQKFGWVIHGLWAQSKSARRVSEHPRFCQGDLPMLPSSVIKPYLAESPSAALLQAEWEKHGACAFRQAEQYFQKQQKLYRTLTLPKQQFNSRNELFAWMKKNNPQLKNAYLGASHNELFICYGLDWQVIDCPRNR